MYLDLITKKEYNLNMKISVYTVEDNKDTTRGYGAALSRVVDSLNRLGHEVVFDDPTVKVQISFCSPAWYRFHPGQYKIGYTPWESTELPDKWVDFFNDCDEVWATSPWTAEVYKNAGVTKPIHVYRHGVDHKWAPHKRFVGDKVKYLHIGEPALRKGGQMTIDAFRSVFGDRKDVSLTVKAYGQHYLRSWVDGELCDSQNTYENVTFIRDQLFFSEMIKLVNEHDVLVYPSYGEGFGLIPLQALGTGMPVISTGEWADYQRFLKPLEIGGSWNRSIWSVHPGDVFYPDYDDLKYMLRESFTHIDHYHDHFFAQAQTVHEEYDWLKITEESFKHLTEKDF